MNLDQRGLAFCRAKGPVAVLFEDITAKEQALTELELREVLDTD